MGRAHTTPRFTLPMPGTMLRRRVESELRDERPTVAEIASLEAVPDLVRAGVGQAILPGFLLPRDRKGLRVKRLAHMGTDTICSIRMASEHEYPAAVRFEELVQKCFGSVRKSRLAQTARPASPDTAYIPMGTPIARSTPTSTCSRMR